MKLNLARRAAEGAVMVVRDFTAEPSDDGELPPLLSVNGTPATITVLGIDSPQAKSVLRRQSADAYNRAQARQFANKRSAPVLREEDIAQQEANLIEFLVEMTVDWTGLEHEDGRELPFSPENARDVYEQCPPIREQVKEFIEDRRRFFGNSATTPAPSQSTSSH